MRFFAPVALTYLAAAAGTYGNLKLTSTNTNECTACPASTATMQEKDVTDCLAKVPATCLYTVDLTNTKDTAATVCPDTLGVDLTPLWTTIPSAAVTKMTGALTLVADASAADCKYDVYHSSTATDKCVAQGGTKGTQITFTDVLSLNLGTYSDKYYNLVTTDAASCGTKLSSAKVSTESLVLTMSVKGTSGTTPDTPESSTEAVADNTSGVAPLMTLSVALGLLGAVHVA